MQLYRFMLYFSKVFLGLRFREEQTHTLVCWHSQYEVFNSVNNTTVSYLDTLWIIACYEQYVGDPYSISLIFIYLSGSLSF